MLHYAATLYLCKSMLKYSAERQRICLGSAIAWMGDSVPFKAIFSQLHAPHKLIVPSYYVEAFGCCIVDIPERQG